MEWILVPTSCQRMRVWLLCWALKEEYLFLLAILLPASSLDCGYLSSNWELR
jgi:hypothetical protein